MENACARRATARPMRPRPTMPRVAPALRSRPTSMRGPQIHGSPDRTNRSASTTRRVTARIIAKVWSAVASSSTPGVFVTTTPRRVASGDVDVVVPDRDVGDDAQLRTGGVEELGVDPLGQRDDGGGRAGDVAEQAVPLGRRLLADDDGQAEVGEARHRDVGQGAGDVQVRWVTTSSSRDGVRRPG